MDIRWNIIHRGFDAQLTILLNKKINVLEGDITPFTAFERLLSLNVGGLHEAINTLLSHGYDELLISLVHT